VRVWASRHRCTPIGGLCGLPVWESHIAHQLRAATGSASTQLRAIEAVTRCTSRITASGQATMCMSATCAVTPAKAASMSRHFGRRGGMPVQRASFTVSKIISYSRSRTANAEPADLFLRVYGPAFVEGTATCSSVLVFSRSWLRLQTNDNIQLRHARSASMQQSQTFSGRSLGDEPGVPPVHLVNVEHVPTTIGRHKEETLVPPRRLLASLADSCSCPEGSSNPYQASRYHLSLALLFASLPGYLVEVGRRCTFPQAFDAIVPLPS
jgi:hypothetical protein